MHAGFFDKVNALLTGRLLRSEEPRETIPAAQFTNAEGYRLAYDIYGKRSGYPLFYFHDGGSSRLEAAFFHNAAHEQGFRLIAIDRPGVGCSDFYESATTSDFCDDVLLLADQLGIAEFGVMSLAAGGIYATTLAYMQPARTRMHLNLAGMPGVVFNENPANTVAANFIHEVTPLLIKLNVRLRHVLLMDKPHLELERMQEFLSYTDRKTLSLPRVRRTLALDQFEATRNGARGVAQDLAMCFRKLEFRLHDVAVPTVIWQGAADRLSSRSDCEYMAARLPSARYYRVQNRGHFFFVTCMNEVFQRLRTGIETRQNLAA